MIENSSKIMIITTNIQDALNALKRGEIIAYPTEAVFGLGCDPFNESAVQNLLALKHRPVSKGLILIAHDWEQVANLSASVAPLSLQQAQSTWPGPMTWVFPATPAAPSWISGHNPSIALRITAHPLASTLCQAFGGPIVSTSANVDGEPPARDITTLQQYFKSGISVILDAPLGDSLKPTPIRDVMTGKLIRV